MAMRGLLAPGRVIWSPSWCQGDRVLLGRFRALLNARSLTSSGPAQSGSFLTARLATRAPVPTRGLSTFSAFWSPLEPLGANVFHCSAIKHIVSSAVPQDVLLFKHQKGGFFRVLGFFIVGQFVFWTYLAHFAFSSLKDTGIKGTVIEEDEGKRQPRLGGVSLNLGSNKWRYGFTVGCLTIGSVILAAGFIFSRRSVHKVLLHRGGQEVTFTTYYPFGMTTSFMVPLREVSCVSHRSEVPSMIPVKVKGHPFYFLLDKEGQFFNARLFDVTVGAYRKL